MKSSAMFKGEHAHLPDVQEGEVLGVMGHEGAELLAAHDVPRRSELLVEARLDELGDVVPRAQLTLLLLCVGGASNEHQLQQTESVQLNANTPTMRCHATRAARPFASTRRRWEQ